MWHKHQTNHRLINEQSELHFSHKKLSSRYCDNQLIIKSHEAK